MAGKKISAIYCWQIESEDITIYLASSERGAVRVGLKLGKGPDCLKYFKNIFPKASLKKDESRNRLLMQAVKSSLKGWPVSKALKLDIRLTAFQQKVLKKVSLIPMGQTRTYGEVAMIIGKPGGARAVGQVMNKNPLPIIFPCHRIVAAGGIGGFRGGPALKRYLLEKEKGKLMKGKVSCSPKDL